MCSVFGSELSTSRQGFACFPLTYSLSEYNKSFFSYVKEGNSFFPLRQFLRNELDLNKSEDLKEIPSKHVQEHFKSYRLLERWYLETETMYYWECGLF